MGFYVSSGEKIVFLLCQQKWNQWQQGEVLNSQDTTCSWLQQAKTTEFAMHVWITKGQQFWHDFGIKHETGKTKYINGKSFAWLKKKKWNFISHATEGNRHPYLNWRDSCSTATTFVHWTIKKFCQREIHTENKTNSLKTRNTFRMTPLKSWWKLGCNLRVSL